MKVARAPASARLSIQAMMQTAMLPLIAEKYNVASQ